MSILGRIIMTAELVGEIEKLKSGNNNGKCIRTDRLDVEKIMDLTDDSEEKFNDDDSLSKGEPKVGSN